MTIGAMSKEELIEFLKENLTVQVEVTKHYSGYGGKGVRVEVNILLDGAQISSSADSTSLD